MSMEDSLIQNWKDVYGIGKLWKKSETRSVLEWPIIGIKIQTKKENFMAILSSVGHSMKSSEKLQLQKKRQEYGNPKIEE